MVPAHAAHVVFDSNEPEFNLHKAETTLPVPWITTLAYKRYEEAINASPKPLAIVCKTSRRASAVLAAYKGVNQGLTPAEVHDYSKQNGLKYVGSEGFERWVDTVVRDLTHKNPLIFRQLFEKESSTYTYLLADSVTKEALLIDPVLETVERDSQLIKDLGLTLKYTLNTHVHADHITGSGKLKSLHPEMKSVISACTTARADIHLNEYEFLEFGTWKLYGVATPGHTVGCTTFVLDDLSRCFTGDAVLIRGCGRTDFQGGSAEQLYRSIHDKLFKYLPDSCEVWPAHDYKGLTVSSIGEEKRLNPRLTKTLEEFIHIMDNLNLPPPKKINESVPANLQCGLFDL